MSHLKHFFDALVVSSLIAFGTHISYGAVVITATETEDGVVFLGSGSLNLYGLSFQGNYITGAGINPSRRVLLLGTFNLQIVTADTYLGIDGPTSFGTRNALTYPDGETGDRFGITFSGSDQTLLAVPKNYVSGSPLSGSNTYLGYRFSSFGMTPDATYTWSLPNDRLTLQIIPEPSTLLLGTLATMGLLLRRTWRI